MQTASDSSRFTGKVALVTGGATGMGLAAARLFLQEGAKVVITGRNEDRLKRAVEELDGGERLLAVPADVSRPADLDRLMAEIGRRFDHLDIVFANAGIGVFKRLEDFTEEDVDGVTDANFKGVFFTIKHALPLLRGGGSVVINASWTHHLSGDLPSARCTPPPRLPPPTWPRPWQATSRRATSGSTP